MDKTSRREHILEMIGYRKAPLSASLLAHKFNVSRQVIVGDIALLRAQGNEIIATARGYMLPESGEADKFSGKIACRHNSEDTRAELYMIVDSGAVVMDVVVEHELYGEITGQLNLKCRNDVDTFVNRIASSEAKLLSELTTGIHLHTVICRDGEHFERLRQALDTAGYLFRD